MGENFISIKNHFRIISLVPSQTELLVDLGLEKFIVGVTKFCVHPKHLKQQKQIIGGTKTCNFDKIASLNPTHILCNKEENTKEIVEKCSKIARVHTSEIISIEDSIELISIYGSFFNVNKEALQLSKKIDKKYTLFKDFINTKNTLNVAYFIWKQPWMVAASNTYINSVLKINKFNNVFSNKTRYPEIQLEILAKEIKTDLILLSSEPYPFQEKHINEIKKFAKNTKIVLVDGEMFSWHGSRLLKAFDYFINLRNRV